MQVCDAFAYGARCFKRSDYCILGLHSQTGNIMAIIDITQKTGLVSGEEAAVIAIPPA
jgi:chemotaxis signal transduction protein